MSGSAHPGRKRPKKHEEEEHENHERWLVSYADMVTLLMCLFIVLFAMSQVDKAKFAALASGPVGQLRRADHRAAGHDARGLGAGRAPAHRSTSRPASRPSRRPARPRSTPPPPRRPPSGPSAWRPRPRAPTTNSRPPATRSRPRWTQAGYGGAARYEIDERGLVVHIVADAVLFDAEEAVLRPEGKAILDAVAPTLTGLPNVLRVEGHANHLPVTPGGRWPSNWELSAYRATTVLTYLARDGVPEPRMYAAGYGSTQPLVPVTDRTAITVNRRVDIVVLSNASAEANALLPGIDAAHQGVTP